MGVRRWSKLLTATGSAGTATATGQIGFGGPVKILAINVDYTGLPATTDLTVKDSFGNVILTMANTATDAIKYLRLLASKTDGTASAITEVPAVTDRVQIDIVQGDPAGTAEVSFLVEA